MRRKICDLPILSWSLFYFLGDCVNNPGLSLKIARLKAQITQSELAEILGLRHQALVSWWETGRHLPKDHNMIKLKHFLNLDPAAIRNLVRWERQKGGHPCARVKGPLPMPASPVPRNSHREDR
jgi:DNA-binding XRE family transcriptional regulator